MIKVGIIGFAHGHVFQFAGAWLKEPEKFGVLPVCAWDYDEKRLADSLKNLPGVSACASLEELLAADISAVVITCETGYHCEMVEKAAAAGKDIILYKPMAITLKEADRIVEAVNANHVRFSMGWQMRCDAQNIRMKQLIDSGEMGKVCQFRRRHGLSTHLWNDFEHTWHNNPLLNRDIFADDSAHPINYMQWLFGMPETVMCELSTMVNPNVPNDSGVALFKYSNGLIAEISCCFTTVSAEITTEIYFENGAVQQYYGDAPSAAVLHQNGLRLFKTGDAGWSDSGIPSACAQWERLRDQAAPLADFLKGGAPVCSAEEGRDSLRLVLACFLSAREGKRVSVWDERIYEI